MHSSLYYCFHPSLILYHGSLDELLLASFAILLFASPGLEGRGLQGAAIGEGDGPGPV